MSENIDEKAADFLLAEYQEIYQEFRRVRQEGINRLNFFITLTTAVVGGMLLLNEIGSLSEDLLKIIAIAALLVLLTVGWDTFNFAISRDIATDLNIRATARIRRYFADQYPAIEQYLTWTAHDQPTTYLSENISGVRRTTQSLLAMICALTVGLLASAIVQQIVIISFIGVLAFTCTMLLLREYAKRHYKRAADDARNSIRFPKERKELKGELAKEPEKK